MEDCHKQKFNLNPNSNSYKHINNNNILPVLDVNLTSPIQLKNNNYNNNNYNNLSLIKGFSNDIHENLFTEDINEILPTYGDGILNEDIFKNRKFSELKKKNNNNYRLNINTINTNNNNNIDLNGLMNILSDKNWGQENKTRGITTDTNVNNNHGKIYRELGKYFYLMKFSFLIIFHIR
jgi:hypothetical protein